MNPLDHRDLMPGATACVECFVNVTKGDKILIITDNPEIAEALAVASKKAGGEVTVYYLPRVLRPIERLNKTLENLIFNSTVVFTPFEDYEKESSFRAEIVKLAVAGKKRKIAHMPSVTSKMFMGEGMLSLTPTEMQKMKEITEKLAILLSATKKVRIKSADRDETDLKLELEGWDRSGIVSTGHIMKGSWGNLPSGEAFVLPKKGTANGTIVVDRAISYVPNNELPVTIGITDGIVDSIGDGESLRNLLKDYPENARLVCEFGIGTNPKHATNHTPVEIEKMLKTIHIAIGSNTAFGGDIEAPIHIDMVISKPNVWVTKLFNEEEIPIIEKSIINEGRIDSFFNVHYENLSRDIKGDSYITVKNKKIVEAKEDDMLYRCWNDHRGHNLRIPVGNNATAKKVIEVWSCIDPDKPEQVKNIIKRFCKKFNGDSKLVYQLLNTLEKFGIIDITQHIDGAL